MVFGKATSLPLGPIFIALIRSCPIWQDGGSVVVKWLIFHPPTFKSARRINWCHWHWVEPIWSNLNISLLKTTQLVIRKREKQTVIGWTSKLFWECFTEPVVSSLIELLENILINQPFSDNGVFALNIRPRTHFTKFLNVPREIRTYFS